MKLALLLVVAVSGLACAAETSAPSRWAKKIERPGLKNFHRVTANLYRGAQPTAEGLRAAEAMGVKTVIDLRVFHSDAGDATGTKLTLERISFNTWHPEDEDVLRFLQIVTARRNQPVFVHCHRGSDRTGMMIAIYRIAAQGWSKRDAIDEMTKGNFGFNPKWKNLVAFIEKLDVAALKRRAGLSGQ